MHECVRCGQIKSADEFYRYRKSCKECVREARRVSYQKNIEYERKQAREYQARDRDLSRQRCRDYFERHKDREREKKRNAYRLKQYGTTEPILERASKPTWVYVLTGERDEVIYVGISIDYERRLKEHSKRKTWWHEVRHISLTWCEDRTFAEKLEVCLIEDHLPKYNVALNPRRKEVARWPAPLNR